MVLVGGAVLFAAPGCSGTVVYGSGGAGGTGGAGTGGSGGGAPGPCPTTAPSGGSCTEEGRRCTYGVDVRPDCRQEWQCHSGKWMTTKSVCIEPPTAVCNGAIAGDVCAAEGDHCVTAGSTICTCSACLGGPCMAPPPKWSCNGPPTTKGCPTLVPNDGTSCTQNGVECVYGNPCLGSGADVKCTQGVWTWNTMIACAV